MVGHYGHYIKNRRPLQRPLRGHYGHYRSFTAPPGRPGFGRRAAATNKALGAGEGGESGLSPNPDAHTLFEIQQRGLLSSGLDATACSCHRAQSRLEAVPDMLEPMVASVCRGMAAPVWDEGRSVLGEGARPRQQRRLRCGRACLVAG